MNEKNREREKERESKYWKARGTKEMEEEEGNR